MTPPLAPLCVLRPPDGGALALLGPTAFGSWDLEAAPPPLEVSNE